jgi:NAD(P)-dependent dehydrogenase (short-subunit alcohol dehydrogenase family)
MSKVWFITGASRGLGAEIAKAALQAGHRVVATGRNLAQLREVYQNVPEENIALVALDVSVEAQAHAATQAAVERFGRIDVLVNNAGYGQLGNFEEVSAQAIERQFATNVFGLMHVMRAVLPVMRRQRAGHVFNLSSIGGALGFIGAAVYCAAKHAVEGLSTSVELEVASFGIRVTVVEPGFFRTDFLDARSISYGDKPVDDYAGELSARDVYEGYNHRQPGDPARLGAALVEIAGMANPPRQFLAGSDAIDLVSRSLESRLQEIRAFASLSRSTDGAF